MTAYYNEIDEYAAQWLRNLIAAGLIPAGDVDTRSIVDVRSADLVGYRQCHFFAGIGGWALAARLAGWPDDRELWTGSCPCQPFSVAGSQRGTSDERHLWPDQFRLIRDRRPAVWLGEQVAAAVGKHWLDGVLADLEGIGYAGRAVVVPACAVDAPHRRDRLWLAAGSGHVVHGVGEGLEGCAGYGDGSPGRTQPDRPITETGSSSGILADTAGGRREMAVLNSGASRAPDGVRETGFGGGDGARGKGADVGWHGAGWIVGHDGKARRVEPSIYPLAHGVPARVGRLRAYGNAIVPQVAAEVMRAYLDCAPLEAAA